ncbi:hypothetical protein SRHO_G00040670 [Serrasalmus rhombeus]
MARKRLNHEPRRLARGKEHSQLTPVGCDTHTDSMAVDWLGFGYAAAVVFRGFVGYKRKGSKLSSCFKQNVQMPLFLNEKLDAINSMTFLDSYLHMEPTGYPLTLMIYGPRLVASGALALVMGMRVKNSGK